jgi:two-component system chemotaxis response regulator CheY
VLTERGLGELDILIVDDNAQMRTIVGSVLTAVGCRRLHFAPDGRHGLETLRLRSIDVIYVDYEMPVMNGLDFLKAVRNLEGPPRFTPVIMLTGHSDMKRLTIARDRGVNEFLTKPVTATTILRRLESVILRPRPFIKTDHYFGPDRRRGAKPSFRGPFRRAADQHEVIEV